MLKIKPDKNQRIIYIEPNDVYDKESGADGDLSLTPKYEDFCISFNLIIEQFSRIKPDGIASDINGRTDSSGNRKQYVIQWGLTQEDLIKRRTSVLQGNMGDAETRDYKTYYPYSDKYNYLTTYYTDITYDNYANKTEIEGLGVENVQISYESWYTPTVTIKFVDIRGASIFGREEAIHNDGNLMAENVFGAFFTMPFPLFRLQVKGFFGKPVTYQLTCSSFKGEFNAQTGNFEAVATFIGYSWSLLTDIPFAYLVAAPYATYIGSEYWENNKSKDAWGLWNDGNKLIPPPKLYHLFDNIKNALKREEFGKPNEEQSQELSQMGNEKKLLNMLKDKHSAFIRGLEERVDKNNFIGPIYDEETKNSQLLLFSNSSEFELNIESYDIKTKYDEFYASLREYELADYKNGSTISTEKAPNKWGENPPPKLSFKDVFTIETDTSENVTSITVNGITEITEEKLQELELNENGSKITKALSKILFTSINDRRSNIRRYCYLVDLYDIPQQIEDRGVYMIDREKKITQAINDNINKSIVDVLGGIGNGGFKPFIGNVFKIIFCHLETFCHIMFDSAAEIYDQMRTGKRNPDQLGISIDKTDLNEDAIKYITPWPALYDKGVASSECGYTSETENVYGWVGDIERHKFIEEKVVYALQEGIQMITSEGESSTKEIRYSAFPILPSDYINGGVFTHVNIENKGDIAGHLGNRIASIVGVLCGNNVSDEIVTKIGKMDALNLYSRKGSIVTFGNTVKDVDADMLEGIMFCDGKYDTYANPETEGADSISRFPFETSKKIDEKFAKPVSEKGNSRHPIFADVGGNDKSLYVHYYDEIINDKFINYVPSTIKAFETYKVKENSDIGDFTYNISYEKQYFTPKITKTDNLTNAHDWLHVCDTTKIKALKDESVDLTKYNNKQMFSVITDKSTIESIKNKCTELKNGDIKVMDYEFKEDLSDFINDFYGTDNNFYSDYFKNVSLMLSGNANKLQLDRENFIPSNNGLVPKTFKWIWYETVSTNSNIKNRVKVDENCDFLWNDEKTPFSELVIQDFKVIYENGTCNLFACPFYYMQNEKINDKEDDDNFYVQRTLRSKAFLFLNTFKYSNRIPNVFDKEKKHGAIQLVPKGFLLLCGGMLWRKRFQKENGYDPILTKNNEITYYNPGVNYSFRKKSSADVVSFYVGTTNDVKEGDYISLFEYFGCNDIDYNIENQLIELFNNFVDNVFSKIGSKYELKKIVDGNVVNFISTSIKSVINVAKNVFDISTDDQIAKWLDDNIYGLRGNYNALHIKDKDILLLLNEDNKEDQELFKDLYFNPYAIMDNCYKLLGKNYNEPNENDRIYVKKSLLKSYLKGFVEQCKDIIATQTVSVGDDNLNVSTNTFRNRDLSLAIYYYLKNLWDKWLVIAETDAFDVNKFFDENFVFIDSFYKNVYNKLAINCEQLLNAWTELADNGSLFHFLSQIVSKHGCIFLPVPDYVGFNGDTDNDDYDIKTMEDLFRPIPYNSMDAPSNSNKFIVMYSHSPSHISTSQNGYKSDSYDIVDTNGEITDDAKNFFKYVPNKDNTITREGYNVPSFGIAFGRQNNHLFKNLRLTMDNPVMTEQAIKAQWQIAVTGGSSQAHSIHFIGQDTFNVFSNYSYSITVDMMGNAQICPLMYFQLLNVPLWRGTYMIYKVTHNLTPGDMTTTITAMKMNKFAQPFNSNFFTIHLIKKAEQDNNGLNNNCDDNISNGVIPSISGGKITNAPTVNVKDNTAYNLVLWRYRKDSTLWSGGSDALSGHSIEGVIYEYNSKEILAWTIQSDAYDLVGGKREYYTLEPGGNLWLSAGKPKYHFGCSYYCAKIANKRGGFGEEGKPNSMIRVSLSDKNTGGCLFHPGKNAGSGWTKGCILTGERAVNGNRPNFDISQFYKENIEHSSNEGALYWKNFYNKVVSAICSGKKVHMYVKTEYANVKTDGAVVQSGGNVTSNPTGNLVDIKASLPQNLQKYVKIMAIYAKSKQNTKQQSYNFGNRCMPGYKENQQFLWIGKNTFKLFEKAVKYMDEHYSNYTLIILDAYRPQVAAQNFEKIYQENNGRSAGSCYIASLNGGTSKSQHCKGEAIDLILGDSNGNPLWLIDKNQIPSQFPWSKNSYGFDVFNSLASPKPNQEYQNILREIMMKGGGMKDFPKGRCEGEFWHFSNPKNEDNCDGSKNYG